MDEQREMLPIAKHPRSTATIANLKFALMTGILLVAVKPALALPPPTDQPEEVLRTEIITGARSPITGAPISASEYAQLQAELQTPGPSRPELAPSIRKNISLLKLRKFLKTFFPFLPVP